ncbi:MAG TPA: hydroxymethylbilane synthase [Candidatus Polarisedimenticolia bacterium]|jgi:hydroxymethylbilane synthase
MILGTRGSPLALTQTHWVRDRLMTAHSDLVVTVEIIRTTGDRNQLAPPRSLPGSKGPDGGKGIFVKEIEDGLLAGRIDAAVHSLKDLPTGQPPGLIVAATPQREDPRDALVTREEVALEALPRGARVGTGSPRRAAQLRAVRPDLIFEPARGNVDTRIRRMMGGAFDAVVLAVAGLSRLGYMRGTASGGAFIHPIPEEICLPAVGQGALAIETREADTRTRSLISTLHDPVAAAEVAAERAFLGALGGGCRVPVAALARATNGRLSLAGLVASPDGSEIVKVRGESAVDSAADLGRRLALEALELGARAVIRRYEESGG